ncbi:MAG TPA: hypothetical protein EYP32_03950 [Aquificaceae bacterium]|nr:hypothetical protein [Aquificaceae bacterium]
MWQVEINGFRKDAESGEEVLKELYKMQWDEAKVMCMECGELLEVEDEIDLFAFIEEHDGHFGTVLDLVEFLRFESLEEIREGGEEV